MLARLVLGLVKGLVVGLLVGFGLSKLGFAVPAGVFAYLGAAVAGVLTGLVAGKPIWAKDAKIEAGMKAVVGAALASGLMYAARRWLTMDVPGGLLALLQDQLGSSADLAGATVGSLALTSIGSVSAVLGGFYEVDNTPGESAAAAPAKGEAAGAKGKQQRVAAPASEEEEEELEAEPAEKKRAKK